jgi:hypothetical protein
MDEKTLSVLEDEANQIEARELDRNPAFRRWKLIRALIQDYRLSSGGSAPTERSHAMPTSSKTRQPRSNSNAAQIVQIAEEFLSRLNRRAPSSEIWEEAARKGIKIVGEKPAAVVASYLSNSSLFDNVRGQGYGLAKWKDAVPNDLSAVRPLTARPVTASRRVSLLDDESEPPDHGGQEDTA